MCRLIKWHCQPPFSLSGDAHRGAIGRCDSKRDSSIEARRRLGRCVALGARSELLWLETALKSVASQGRLAPLAARMEVERMASRKNATKAESMRLQMTLTKKI